MSRNVSRPFGSTHRYTGAACAQVTIDPSNTAHAAYASHGRRRGGAWFLSIGVPINVIPIPSAHDQRVPAPWALPAGNAAQARRQMPIPLYVCMRSVVEVGV